MPSTKKVKNQQPKIKRNSKNQTTSEIEKEEALRDCSRNKNNSPKSTCESKITGIAGCLDKVRPPAEGVALYVRCEKKRKNNAKESDKVISFIMRFIPPWSIFALPGIVGTLSSMYLGFGGMVVGGMFASVILCLLFIGPSLDRYRYDYVFEEAQKILDERNK